MVTAMGVTAAMVPQLVPMAREMKQETANIPGRMREAGIKYLEMATAESTAPVALATEAKAPARMKMRHMIMILGSPMPLAKVSVFSARVTFRFIKKAVAEATRKAVGIGML
jgi:hypothetical protein